MNKHEIQKEFLAADSREHQNSLLTLLRKKGEIELVEELEMDLLCEYCNGTGTEVTMEQVYTGQPEIKAPIGEQKCGACNGSGLEKDSVIS